MLLGLVGLGIAGFAVVDALDDDPGRLLVVQDLPDDVRTELQTTWTRFGDRFAARRTCIADVTVVLVDDVVGGDARYVGDERRIEVEIPTTPARFRESVAHELGHHVERTCDDFAALRTELHHRFGGESVDWAGGEVWEETPSELWAEVVVALVNGERLLHDEVMPLDPVAVELAARWGRGEPLRG